MTNSTFRGLGTQRSSEAVLFGSARARLLAAFAAIYVLYGGNYLAIRETVRNHIPALSGGGLRYVLAGLILLGALRVRGQAVSLSAREARITAVIGLLLIGSFGWVALAEKHIGSGLTSLLVAATPLFVIVLRRVLGRERVPVASMVGVTVGFVGVAILAISHGGGTNGSAPAIGMVLLTAAGIAIGSFVVSRTSVSIDPFLSAGWQMIWGGFVLVVVGLAVGEGSQINLAIIPTRGIVAFIYLATFGGFVCFSAYVWLLGKVPVSQVTTSTYVNPVVAVLLGWTIAGEKLSATSLASGALILVSVAAVLTFDRSEVRGLPAPVQRDAFQDQAGGA